MSNALELRLWRSVPQKLTVPASLLQAQCWAKLLTCLLSYVHSNPFRRWYYYPYIQENSETEAQETEPLKWLSQGHMAGTWQSRLQGWAT